MRLNSIGKSVCFLYLWLAGLMAGTVSAAKYPESAKTIAGDNGAMAGVGHRVLVSTDIGGTDPDDFQSMIHLLVYADVLDIEGIISSPFGPGRKEHILEVIDCYEQDYANLKTYSDHYPGPDALRSITKQGETERAPYAGVRLATEGSQWIVECARRDEPRPLHVLGLGRHRGSRPGASRRPRYPAQAAGLLDRRTEQEMES